MSVVTEMQVKLDMLCRQISELSMRFSLNQQVSMERAGVAQDRQAVLPEPPGSADLLYLVDLQGTPYAPPVPPLALRDGELPDGDLPQVPLKAVSHHEKLFRGGALFKLEAQAPNKIEVQHKCTEQRSESSSNKHAHGGMTVAASLLTQVEKRACEEIKETRQPLLEKQKEEALQPPAVLDAVTSPPTLAGGEGQASPLGVFGEVAVEVDAVPAAKKKEVLPHEVLLTLLWAWKLVETRTMCTIREASYFPRAARYSRGRRSVGGRSHPVLRMRCKPHPCSPIPSVQVYLCVVLKR